LKSAVLWRLISHLSLNHLSLIGERDGARALKELLTLYGFAGGDAAKTKVAGILNVTARRSIDRVNADGVEGFCRGSEVLIEFDQERFADNGLFLFAAVLERFLGLYCSINSFTRLTATTHKREGVWFQWPPRAGEKPLL
jgi:type VI secretion system protein ImpG